MDVFLRHPLDRAFEPYNGRAVIFESWIFFRSIETQYNFGPSPASVWEKLHDYKALPCAACPPPPLSFIFRRTSILGSGNLRFYARLSGARGADRAAVQIHS